MHKELVDLSRSGEIRPFANPWALTTEQALDELPTEQLRTILIFAKERLAQLGVRISINELVTGAVIHGNEYEDKAPLEAENNWRRVTPMNVFMVLLHNQSDIGRLPTDQRETIGRMVCLIAMTVQTAGKRGEALNLPEDF